MKTYTNLRQMKVCYPPIKANEWFATTRHYYYCYCALILYLSELSQFRMIQFQLSELVSIHMPYF